MEDTDILAEIGYKPYGSQLLVYNDRIVGKRSGIAIGGFSGEILIKDIQNIEYNPGIPVITVPRIHITHRMQDRTIKSSTITFLGIIPRAISGISGPKDVYQLIYDLVNKNRN